MLDKVHLDSTVIASLHYDPATNTLDVAFTTGRLYRYFMIPRKAYESWLAAESAGKYFNAHIRDRYAYEEVLG